MINETSAGADSFALFQRAVLTSTAAIPPSRDDVEIVYHYTNTEGLVGILESRAIWATQAPYLNDASEIDHGEELLIGAVAPLLQAEADPKFELPKKLLLELRDQLRHSADPFISSFCMESNLLSMWRAY